MSGYGLGLYGEGLYGLGVTSGPTDLHALCDDLLAASVEALDTIPGFDAALLGAPERYFVSPGQPALDCCDQLTVHAASVTEAATNPGGLMASRRNVTGRVNLVGLVVTITRCIPGPKTITDTVPSSADLQAAAEQTNADAWALWNHLWNLWRSGDLFSICGEVYWDGFRSLTNSGGCGGWVGSWRVSLDGYNDVASS